MKSSQAENLNLRQIISKGSKSFYFASLFLPSHKREDVFALYAWCRYCDDLIDDVIDLEAAKKNLSYLNNQLSLCYEGKHKVVDPYFQSLQKIIEKYSIPIDYPRDLLMGMEWDVERRVYEDYFALEHYCYCVAGTVGLMMCHIMDVSDPEALDHAVSLGIAMQLTNIARDVLTDQKIGRVYLPTTELQKLGWIALARESLLEHVEKRNGELEGVLHNLLFRARNRYCHAYSGLKYLPLGCAFAIRLAGEIYSRIGHVLLTQGSERWKSRAYVPLMMKVLLTLMTSFYMFKTALEIVFQKRNKEKLRVVWKYH